MAQAPPVFDFRAKLKKVSTGTGEKPTKPGFKLPILSVTTEKGKKFTMKVGISGYPKPIVTWLNKGQKVSESDNIKMFTDKQDPDMHIIEVLKADLSHAGEWTCEAANQVGKETMSAKVSIKKQSKPVVLDPLKNTQVFKGQNLKLKVKYEGCPIPSCKWTRGGKEVGERRGVEHLHNDAEGTKELIVYDVSDMHAGDYTCELKNAAGVETTKCSVTIKEAMIKPAFDGDIKGGKIDWGKEFKLTTRVHGNPKPKVKWMKDGVEVKDGENGVKLVSDDAIGKHDLIIEDFGPEHVGDYQCVAESEAGSESANYSCQPEKPPKKPKIEQPLTATKVLRGKQLRLVSKISGEPTPDVTWTKNGKPLDPAVDGETYFDFETGEAELIVNNCDDQHKGQYELKVNSRIGTDVSTTKVDITEPPHIKPTFDVPLSTIYDPAKQLLILRCKVSGYPKPELTWSGPDGSPLKEGPEVEVKDAPDDPDMRIIHIKCFTEAKEGEYSATATSVAGTTKRSINISIKQTKQENTNRPQFEIPLKVDFDPMNGRIVLSCRVGGEPKPEVKWLKYNEDLKSEGDYELKVDEENNQILVISNVSSNHHGDYSCMATSPLGMAKQTCTLVLKEKPKVEMVDRPVLEKGKPFLLGFRVTGGENIKVRWLRNGEELQSSEEIELKLEEENIHRLRIAALNEASAGDYTIEAAGEGGTVRSTISLSFSEGGAVERSVLLAQLNPVAIKDICSQLTSAGFKCSGSKIVKARVDLLQNQFSSNAEVMGKLVAMPDKPVFISVWEGNGVCTAAAAKVQEGSGKADSSFASVVYSSASAEAGKKEVGIWFKPYELSAWNFADVFP